MSHFSRSWRQPSEISNSKRPGGSDSGGSKLSQEKVNYIYALVKNQRTKGTDIHIVVNLQ